MLLQTFLQLHILLAATPALAGWTLFAPVVGQGAPVRVVSVSRTAAFDSQVPTVRILVVTANAAQPLRNPVSYRISVTPDTVAAAAGAERSVVCSVGTFSSAQSPRAP